MLKNLISRIGQTNPTIGRALDARVALLMQEGYPPQTIRGNNHRIIAIP